MLKLVPDHHKTKKICNYANKKLPFIIRYVPDKYKTKKGSNKVILEIGGTLKSINIRPKKYVIKLLIIMLMH